MRYTFEYSLDIPVSLHEKGKRDYSEDYIYPKEAPPSPSDRIFMVCDGVGGSVRGDEASRFVCTRFPVLIQQTLNALTPDDFREAGQEAFINKQLKQLEAEIDAHVSANPVFMGMATTLTYLHLSPYGAIVAWAGDSRIYHVRSGKGQFISEDHSLVNELVKRGEITKQEAAHHPRKNVILRAVSGSSNPTRADVKVITDIEPGDIFLLATDGILEGISEENLLLLLSSGKTPEEIKTIIHRHCDAHSRDNFSMYLIRVLNIARTELILPSLPAKTEALDITSPVSPRHLASVKQGKSMPTSGFKKLLAFMLSIMAVLLLIAGYLRWNRHQNSKKSEIPVTARNEPFNSSVEKIKDDKFSIAVRYSNLNKLTEDTANLTGAQKDTLRSVSISILEEKNRIEKEIERLDSIRNSSSDIQDSIDNLLRIQCKRLGDSTHTKCAEYLKSNPINGENIRETLPDRSQSSTESHKVWTNGQYYIAKIPDGAYKGKYTLYRVSDLRDMLYNKTPFDRYIGSITIDRRNDPIVSRTEKGKTQRGCLDGADPTKELLKFAFDKIEQVEHDGGKRVKISYPNGGGVYYLTWPPPPLIDWSKHKQG